MRSCLTLTHSRLLSLAQYPNEWRFDAHSGVRVSTVDLTTCSVHNQEFLYEHSYEDCGDIVVDIKQALRALDIWGLEHRGSPTSSKSPTKSSISSRGKEARLGTKSQNRFGVVTGPRSENMRISYEFQDAQDSYTEFATDKRNHSYNGSVPTSPSKTSKQPYPGADDELVAIANELT